jgi:ubiquinone/menaquinone biosynthesis C-methylase UbiE
MNYNSQTDYWDSVASDKHFTTNLDISLINKKLNKDSLIVDYGCGYGRTLNQLKSKGFNSLIGYDYSSKMIERGKKEYPQLDLRISKNNVINCYSNTVDMVILFAVLTCIIENEIQKSLINEIHRILKPGGYIYINDFLLNTDKRNVERYDKFVDKYKNYGTFELSEGAILRHHDKKWIKQLTGIFDEYVNETITFKTMNGNKSVGIKYIGKKMN